MVDINSVQYPYPWEDLRVDMNAGQKEVVVEKRRIPDRRVNPDRRNGRSALKIVRRVFTTSEACRYLQISRPTFLKLISAGKIRASKIGKGWKVLDTELDRFLSEAGMS